MASLLLKLLLRVGENSSVPHWKPSDRKIKSCDMVLIDMGCSYNGYGSDMTRTVFVDKVEEDMKAIYDLVYNNQKIAINEIKDGAQVKIISRIVEGNLKIHGYDLVHALGHGVGMDVHENPVISQKNERVLKDKMVVAVEPGVYIAGRFGVRIEDTVLVNGNGFDVLTKSPKDYCIVG